MLTVNTMLAGQPLPLAAVIVTLLVPLLSLTAAFQGHELVALVVMPVTVVPNTPLVLQPPKVQLVMLKAAGPEGVELAVTVPSMRELVHVIFWPLFALMTKTALPLRTPHRTSPTDTAGPVELPTVSTAPAAAAVVIGSAASAAATMLVIASRQDLRMGTLPSPDNSPVSNLRPAVHAATITGTTSTSPSLLQSDVSRQAHP